MISSRLAIYLVAPVLTIGFIAVSFSLASAGLLPDPVAIHWGVSGQADQFLDLNSYLWLVTISFVFYWSGDLQVLHYLLVRQRPLFISESDWQENVAFRPVALNVLCIDNVKS